jgi:hypothetical protein
LAFFIELKEFFADCLSTLELKLVELGLKGSTSDLLGNIKDLERSLIFAIVLGSYLRDFLSIHYPSLSLSIGSTDFFGATYQSMILLSSGFFLANLYISS